MEDQRAIARIRFASLHLLHLTMNVINEHSVIIRPDFTPSLCQRRTLTPPAWVAVSLETTVRSEVSSLSAPDQISAGLKETGSFGAGSGKGTETGRETWKHVKKEALSQTI